MRTPLRAKRRENQQILDKLKETYPRASFWTYYDQEEKQRYWCALYFKPEAELETFERETRAEYLERTMAKTYPYVRGTKQ